MTVILPQQKLAYFAVPKVACTTIKTKLFQIENGTDLERLTVNGRPFPIHRLYPTRDFADVNHQPLAQYRRFAVVRDPLARFVSAYRNRVLEKNEIANSRHVAELRAQGLPLQPDLTTFITHLRQYFVVRGISHHFSPMTTFLGPDPAYFERIYDISESDQLIGLISSLAGRPVQPSRHNASEKGGGAQPTPAQQDWIREFYRHDYEIFGRFFR